MRLKFIIGTALLIFSPIFADDKDVKLDSIISITNEIRAEVKKKSPIEKYKFGLEINPVLPLFGSGDGFMFTGGLQFFNWDRDAEISFPFQIISASNSQVFTLDLHYRKFLGETQNGFYLSAFTRTAYLEYNHYFFDQSPDTFRDTRLGLGAGLGYRIYSSKRLYWGFSFNMGKFLIYKEPTNFGSFDLLIGTTSNLIMDIEFFKFGYAF